MRRLSNLIFVLAVAFAFAVTSQSAQARQVWPTIGDRGDGTATSECSDGESLVGLTGHVGMWIDQIGIVCAAEQANGMPGAPTFPAREYFGGPGGGPVTAVCPAGTRPTSAFIMLMNDNRMVKYVVLTCIDLSGNTQNVNFMNLGGHYGDSTRQQCGNERFKGITVRYGRDVNGLGMICDRVSAPAPAILRDYSPPPPPKVVVLTGHLTPEQRAALPPAPFAGIWNTETGLHGKFTLTIRTDGKQATGDFIDDGGDQKYNGTLTGTIEGNFLKYTYTQPAVGGTGYGRFQMLSSNNVFTGAIFVDDAAKTHTTWTGRRR